MPLMYGPERCCDASCLIASITRSQTATPPRSPSRREFLSSFGAFRHCLVAVAVEHQGNTPDISGITPKGYPAERLFTVNPLCAASSEPPP